MDLVLDNNIVIDHIGKREPFYELSRKTCLLGAIGEANTYISVNMLSDLFYLFRKDYGSERAQELLEENLSFLHLVGITPEDAQWALAQRWGAFEDCLVARCAQKASADYIVTRNVKDFARSPVKAITPEELFEIYREQGITFEEIPW